MNFAIFYHPSKHESVEMAKSIASFLIEKKCHVCFEENPLIFEGAKSLNEIDKNKIDFSICLGGDGSILRMIHRHPEIKAPILGINMGSLGFLADTPIKETYETLNHLIDGSYTIQNRMMIEGFTEKSIPSFSVNEIVVHRAKNPSLVDLAIYVDGKYLNTFSADGVIFSTPTGSTAYSLSAGGPILTPELEAFVITPISPHTITNRPIVLMPKSEIKVEYVSEHKPVEVIFDGFTSFEMSKNEVLTIKRSKKTFSVVSMNHHDYFSTLRTKLHWSGKLKV